MKNIGSEKERLDDQQIQQFIKDGFTRLDNAFSKELAARCVELLWKDTGCNPHDPNTWTEPVIRLGDYAQTPFVQAANTPLLHTAFDQLAGKGRWLPRSSLGTFPIRFPSKNDPGDTGWHVDASFAAEDADSIFLWRVNVSSKGRALLMLFLFSDVSEQDAPTRIKVGSHLNVARILAAAGEEGMSFMELTHKLESIDKPVVYATGEAGTVYLCHPFLVHGAQPHQGSTPRFMAQPPLYAATDFILQRSDNDYSPVEIAIRTGLD